MSTTLQDTPDRTAVNASAEEFAQRVVDATLATADLFAIFVGDRLGWYRSLQFDGPATADELAARTSTSPRYAREWLEQQAVSGILQLGQGADGCDPRPRFILPPGAAEALTDERSLAYTAPLARMLVASAIQFDALLDAYRTGGGVSWAELGDHAREAQADINRPWFDQLPDALSGIDGLQSVLSRAGARVADVGTGAGWSAIALARAYPQLTVEGFDIDEPSIETARANAIAAGVADRVRFHNADGDNMAHFGAFDAAFAFECIHDMPRPVDVLAAMRQSVRPGAPVVVMDEAVSEHLSAPGDDVDRIMYGFSLFVCLPDGLSHQPSVGTGTVMRPGVLRDYAIAAGFADIEILPIEDFAFFRFYSLVG